MSDSEILELLNRSVKRFNEWKAVRPGGLDLDGANLAGMRLAGADFSNTSLKEADLRGADLTGANLQSAVLYRANATNAVLARCTLDEAYAAEANFENADMTQVRASDANFSRASLQSARFHLARLVNVRFDGADLSNASMQGALLVKTPLPSDQVVLKDAVIEDGSRGIPPMPSVDFKWVSEDGLMFTIGRWTPRPDQSDDEVTPFVLNLRKFNRNDPDALKGFGRLIAKLSRAHHILAPCDTVCAVPASKPEDVETPVTRLAQAVAQFARLRDGSTWLVRHKTVLPSLFLNIGSNEGKHLDSVRVAHTDLVAGRTILLLDDFIDTGSTMRACRHLLHAVGAKRVLCLALGLRLHQDAE